MIDLLVFAAQIRSCILSSGVALLRSFRRMLRVECAHYVFQSVVKGCKRLRALIPDRQNAILYVELSTLSSVNILCQLCSPQFPRLSGLIPDGPAQFQDASSPLKRFVSLGQHSKDFVVCWKTLEKQLTGARGRYSPAEKRKQSHCPFSSF